jgi:hypothetical protein
MLFFLAHYGIFMGVHLLFLVTRLGVDVSNLTLATLAVPLLCVIAMFVAHGIEFFRSYVAPQLFKRTQPFDLFFQPYKRVVIMQLAIIFGFLVLRWIGMAMLVAEVMVLLKMVVDMVLAWRRRVSRPSLRRRSSSP